MKKSVLQNIKSAFNLSYLLLIVLFCFAISTSFMTLSYMAKFVSTDEAGDGARVAKFDISSIIANGQEGSIVLSANSSSATYSFSVTSESDVAVEYDVVLEFPDALSENVKLALDSAENTPDNEGNAYTFTDAGEFPVGGGTNTHTLIFNVSEFGAEAVWEDVAVKVVARQID